MMRSKPRRRLLLALMLGTLVSFLQAAEHFDPMVGDAVKHLLEHNREYQKALADRQKAHLNVIETGAAALPSLSLTATGTRLGNIQSFNFETSDTTSMLLAVAAEDNYEIGLQATQLLFSGSAFQAIGVARSYERVSESALAVQRAALVRDFLGGYAGLDLLRELVVLNEELVTQTKARFDDAKLLHEMGALSRFDLLRSEVEYMNSVPALREAENLLGQAEAGLVLQLGLAPGTTLGTHGFDPVCSDFEQQFPGVLDGTAMLNPVSDAELGRMLEFALSHRPESDLSLNSVEGYRRAVRVYQSGHLPTLAAFANWTRGNQWDMFSQSEQWNSSWNVGVQLSVPLFTGFRTSAQVSKGRQDLRKAREDDSQLKDAIRLELRTALEELQRRSLDMNAWNRNSDVAAEGFGIAATRRESGAGSELELRDARTAMKAARVNQAQARYNLLKARISLLHALGMLDRTTYTDINN